MTVSTAAAGAAAATAAAAAAVMASAADAAATTFIKSKRVYSSLNDVIVGFCLAVTIFVKSQKIYSWPKVVIFRCGCRRSICKKDNCI